MLKEAIFIFFAVVALSAAYPAEETVVGQQRALAVEVSPNEEPLETESLEGAESANPQYGGWGRRGWGGGYYGGGYGRGWGGGYGRGWGGGYGRGWGGGYGGGWGHRGYGWGR